MKFTASVGTALMVVFAHASTVSAAPASTSGGLADVNGIVSSALSEVEGIATNILGGVRHFGLFLESGNCAECMFLYSFQLELLDFPSLLAF